MMSSDETPGPRPDGMSEPVQERLPQNVRQSPPQDVRQSPPQDVRQSLPQDVRQSPPQDVRQSVPQDVRQSPARDTGQTRPSLPETAQRELEALRREIERWHVLAGGDRSLLEALVHHSPHGLLLCDATGRFILQNRAAERIWAGSATIDSVEGWGVYRAFHPDGRPYEAGDWAMARCLSHGEVVQAEEVHFQRFDGTHGILLGSCAPILGPSGELEGALGVFADITALKHVEERLQIITDSLPVLISYIDMDLRYRFTNLNYERWFGRSRADFEGSHMRDHLGDAVFQIVEPYLGRALRGETVKYETSLPYLHGGERFVEATYVPHFGPDRSVLGIVALVTDISERKRWTDRTERLLSITAALADAVTPAQVYAAVVDRTAEVLHASSAGLWLVDEDGRGVTLVRSWGLAESRWIKFARFALDGSLHVPILHALQQGEPIWIPSRQDLLGRYPHLQGALLGDEDHAITTLPLTVEGRRIGALAFTFERTRAPLEEDRAVFLVAARHAAQALERARLFREAELAYTETNLLYRLTDAVNRAQSVEDVYEASLDTIHNALDVERASILFFDDDGVIRFKAWRGLSDGYRRAVEGHTPWRPGDRDPQAVYVEDTLRDDSMSGYRELFESERIRALAFVPLVYESRLLGKFMLYWDAPCSLSERERSIARSIADQVASAVGRKRAQEERERLIEQLSQTVHLNELFAGVVGHDLRNPLSAIMNTAQLALRRDEGERMYKPLSRILSAGERMTRMIEQLLDFTRARAGGGIPVDPQDMNLGEVGKRVLGEIEDANPDRSIRIETTGDLQGFWDPDRLAQVLSNLAGNAVEHGAAGTGVSVVFDGRDPDTVQIRIGNTGTVRPDVLPVLFEPFRGTERRRERAKGLGLGLYITQQIVLAHGGSIAVVSAPDEATTTFTVTLPRRAKPSK